MYSLFMVHVLAAANRVCSMIMTCHDPRSASPARQCILLRIAEPEVEEEEEEVEEQSEEEEGRSGNGSSGSNGSSARKRKPYHLQYTHIKYYGDLLWAH